MKKILLILTALSASFYFQSCTSEETSKDSSEIQDEAIEMEENTATSQTPEAIEYSQEAFISEFPLVDSVLKYSSDGNVNYRLTEEMALLAEELSSNLEGQASVLQYGEGVIVALDQGDIFAKSEIALNDNSKDILRHLAFNLQKRPDTYIMVAGRADSDGSMDKNDKIAYKMAAVAANYLYGCGISEDRFFVDSYGEKYPDYRNNSRLNKDRNRRVDFLIIPSNQMRENVSK